MTIFFDIKKIFILPLVVIFIAGCSPSSHYVNSGVSLCRSGKIDEAIAVYSKDIEINHEDHLAYWDLGACLEGKGKTNEAIAAYKKAIQINPDNTMYLTSLGKILASNNQLDDAIAVFQKLIQLDPDNYDAYISKGVLLSKQGLDDSAIVAYKKSIEINHENYLAYCELGETLRKKGERGKAIEAYEKSVEINHGNAMCLYGLGMAYKMEGRLTAAAEAFNKSITADRSYYDSYIALGITLKQKYLFNQSIEILKKSIEINHNDYIPYLYIAQSYEEVGQFDEALSACEKSIEINNHSDDTYMIIGGLLLKRGKDGDYYKAIDAYHKAISINNKNDLAYYNLAIPLIENNKIEEAVNSYAKAIEINPGEAEYHFALGMTLIYYKVKYKKAINSLEEYLRLVEDDDIKDTKKIQEASNMVSMIKKQIISPAPTIEGIRIVSDTVTVRSPASELVSLQPISVSSQGESSFTRHGRLALVIGNAAYDIGKLQSPVNDAIDIAQVLKRLGFEVELVTDGDFPKIERAVDKFRSKLATKSVGIFFFSGHGAQVGGENYLIPLLEGKTPNSEMDIKNLGFPMSSVLESMVQSNCPVNIAIIDACRDNPFPGYSKSVAKGLKGIDAAPGMLIAFATAPGKTALDGSGRNSPFTKHLLTHIGIPVPVEQMFKNVRIDVGHETKGGQIPWESTCLSSNFSFVQE